MTIDFSVYDFDDLVFPAFLNPIRMDIYYGALSDGCRTIW